MKSADRARALWAMAALAVLLPIPAERSPSPCPYNSPDHLNDLDCPACAEAAKRAGTDS